MKVNYSRKINHFALFFMPVFISIFINYKENIWSQIAGLILNIVFLAILSKPFRERCSVIETMFASFDRPEDRPHTLSWLATQSIAGSIILIILGYFFTYIGKSELILAPVLINGIGDGLAEPIGIKFGKHKYKTKGFFTNKSFYRSIEGSMCVYIVSVLTVILLYNSFSIKQFVLAVMIVPVLLTLAEAWAPHTWDTPFLFSTSGLVLGGISLLHI
jgi:phytol kinase